MESKEGEKEVDCWEGEEVWVEEMDGADTKEEVKEVEA